MTNDITAGPELDAAVARAVGDASVTHNWEDQGSNHYGTAYLCLKCGEVELTDDIEYDGRGECIRPYSTDLNTALLAAEQCGLFTYTTHLGSYSPEMVKYEGGFRWYVERSHETQHGSGSEVLGRGETPALAICRAILALRGDKETK